MVKHYAFDNDPSCDLCAVVVDANGNYVKREDYDALAARLAEAEEDRDSATKTMLAMREQRERYAAEIERLRGLLREACACHNRHCICVACEEVRTAVQPSVMPKCAGCGNEIDPDCCGCGSPIASHTWQDGHAPVPMGCACGYVTTDSADEVQHGKV